ncbi:hypothetical protein [Jeotgalibacillus aurantiacus]|nr:hypothetical protein [Jeotgalibacillus aurantiacus]
MTNIKAENLLLFLSEYQHAKQKAFNSVLVELLIEHGLVKDKDALNEKISAVMDERMDDILKEIEKLIDLKNKKEL